MDERGQDIEKSEHRLLDRKRICGEGSANHSRAKVDPSKCEHIDNSSIRGTYPIILFQIDLKEHLCGNILPAKSFLQLLGHVEKKRTFFGPFHLDFLVDPVCISLSIRT
jgi:hypothetical protein